MSTSLDAALEVVASIGNFVLPIFNFHGRNFAFLKLVQFPYPRNQFFVIMKSFFSTYKIFPGRGCLVPVSKIEDECFREKMDTLAGLNKKVI